MFGGRSIQLARVFGIRVGVHPSWFLILFLFIFSLSTQYKAQFPGHDTKAFVLAAITTAAFFLSLLLHELGHAVVARRNGIGVLGIDLWAFGGLAKLDRGAPTAGIEFRIAAAGPLVTLAIAAATFVAGALGVGLASFWETMRANTPGISAASSVLGYLAFINALILVVNLVPGLPLDGGRITRAIAWWRMGDVTRADALVTRIGRGAGYVLGAAGLWLLIGGGLSLGIWLVFIAVLLTQYARQSEAQTGLSARLAGIRVSDVMDPEPVTLPAQTKLDRALDEFFLRYRWDWFPVVDAMGHFLGLVSRDRVEAVPEALRPGSSVDEVTAHDTRTVYRVGVDEPIEVLLASDGLRQLGALMAVDGDGVLRGVVTIEQVRRALAPITSAA